MARYRLRLVLSLQPLLAVILPFGIVVLLGILWVQPQIRADIEQRQRQLAQAVGMQVESQLRAGATMIRSAAVVTTDPNHGSGEAHRQLDLLLASSTSISSLYVVDGGGRVVDVALKRGLESFRGELLGLDLSANPLFVELQKDRRPHWSKTFLSVIHGGMVAAYALPAAGGAIIGEVDLGSLTEFLTQIATEEGLIILLVDQHGQVIADNNGRYTAQQLNIGNLGLVSRGLAGDRSETGRFELDGSAMTGTIAPLAGIDWRILVAQSNTALFRTVSDISIIVLLGFFSAALAGVFASIVIGRRLAARFAELNNHARGIACGEPVGDWPQSNIDEFSQLSATLQAMAQRLQDSETLYRTLFAQLPDGVVLWDAPPQSPLEFNAAAHNLLGYTAQEFASLTLPDIHISRSDTEIAEIAERLRREGMISFEATHRHESGSERSMLVTLRQIELAGRPKILAMHRDVSALKQAEEQRLSLERQLLHVQKLESLGVLAGGIAHDFNNILLAITGNADMALRRVGKGDSPEEHLQRIKQAAGRAADLARQMLAYSGKGKFLVEALDLNALLLEMLKMLEVSIGKNVALQLQLAEQLPAIEVDATQIRQVVMNLVINAAEAIGSANGVITLTTSRLFCGANEAQRFWRAEDFQEGAYVCLEVADTGCGMDAGTLEKLYDPFFTTKFSGRGLGMSAVQGIIRSHHGAIRVESEPGQGSRFEILFPASTAPVVLAETPRAETWGLAGRVLLVDDEPEVRRTGSEMLRELGFEVVTANDGQAAVEIYRTTPGFDLVVLDLTMPLMDGEQCFQALLKLNPQVRVVMSSGYSEVAAVQKFMGQGVVGFVQKPYGLHTLKKAIQKALPEKSPAPPPA